MCVQIHTDWEQIGISNDFLFGKIMSNPRLCKKLLELILPELEIDRIEYPELQKTIREDVDARSVRLDVYIRDGKGTVYNIEMQAINTRELPRRSRYYQSMIDLQLIDKNQSYKELNQSYVIFICLTDIFGYGHHIYTFENLCKEENGLPLGDGTKKIFLNASGEKMDVSPRLKAFLDYVAGKPSDDEFVKELEEAVKEAKRNREWRHEYMTLLMRDQENQEIGRAKGREEGIAEGMAKGIEKGMAEGIEKGMEKGMTKGMAKGIQAMISTLRDMDMPNMFIQQKLMEKFSLTEEEAKKYLV